MRDRQEVPQSRNINLPVNCTFPKKERASSNLNITSQIQLELKCTFAVPGDGIKLDPDMDYIGCLGSNGQHGTILPFPVTFIVVTR